MTPRLRFRTFLLFLWLIRGKHRDRETSLSRLLRDFSRLLHGFLLLRFMVSAIRGVILVVLRPGPMPRISGVYAMDEIHRNKNTVKSTDVN